MNRLSPHAAFWLSIARIYLGAYWLAHGASKLLNHTQLRIPPWYHGMLAPALAQNLRLAEPAIAIAEVMVGLLLIFGLFTRVSALAAMALGVGFVLTKGAYLDYSAFASNGAAVTVLALVTFALATGMAFKPRGAQHVHATPVDVRWPD